MRAPQDARCRGKERAPAGATLVPRSPWEPPAATLRKSKRRAKFHRRLPSAREVSLKSHNTGGGFSRSRETIAIVGVGLLLSLVPADAQTCDEPHYRWSEKNDEPLASLTPQRVSITTI